MESILLVYKSMTGFTQKYVDWINDVMSCQTTTLDQIGNMDINNYKIIIYGAGIKAGYIRGLKEFKKIALRMDNKKIVIFATGGAPSEMEIVSKLELNNFSADELKCIKFFYFQSGLNYDKMKRFEKMLMRVYKTILEMKKNKTSVEDGTSRNICKSYDYSSSEYIKPMITYLEES